MHGDTTQAIEWKKSFRPLIAVPSDDIHWQLCQTETWNATNSMRIVNFTNECLWNLVITQRWIRVLERNKKETKTNLMLKILFEP